MNSNLDFHKKDIAGWITKIRRNIRAGEEYKQKHPPEKKPNVYRPKDE